MDCVWCLGGLGLLFVGVCCRRLLLVGFWLLWLLCVRIGQLVAGGFGLSCLWVLLIAWG